MKNKVLILSMLLLGIVHGGIKASAAAPTNLKLSIPQSKPNILQKYVFNPVSNTSVTFSDLVGKVAIAARIKGDKEFYDDKKARELCTFNNRAEHANDSLVLVKDDAKKTFVYGLVAAIDGSPLGKRVYYKVIIGSQNKQTFEACNIGKFKAATTHSSTSAQSSK